MAILLSDLLKKLPPNTEERVKKAKDRWNKKIREALRRETRLSLHRRDDFTSKDEIITIPITVCPGLPDELQPLNRKIADEYELALLLAPHRQIITDLANSGQSTTDYILPVLARSKFSSILPQNIGGELISVRRFAEFLFAQLKTFDLAEFILSVNKDVLGVYRYKCQNRFDDPQPRIELYWGVIGLIARDLAIDPEHLTCVVLAHELAHGYTHVGSDADDQYWNTNAFHNSKDEVVEGLAQYYAWLVCKRIDESLSGVLKAYESLLDKQHGPYRAHEPWVKDFTPEHVRLAMLHTRRDRPVIDVDFFTNALESAKAQLPTAARVGAAMQDF